MTEAQTRGVRLSRSARRAQLLVAARDVFGAQGYHAAAMDDIAERAGVSKPVLYQHFPGKLELYRALLTTCADDLVERVRDAIGRTSDNRERVAAAVSAYFDFVAGDGQAYRLVFESDLRGEPEAAAVVDGALIRCIETVAAAVQTLKEAGATDVLCLADFGGLPQERVLRSLELFATEVAPCFAAASVAVGSA